MTVVVLICPAQIRAIRRVASVASRGLPSHLRPGVLCFQNCACVGADAATARQISDRGFNVMWLDSILAFAQSALRNATVSDSASKTALPERATGARRLSRFRQGWSPAL